MSVHFFTMEISVDPVGKQLTNGKGLLPKKCSKLNTNILFPVVKNV